MATPRLPPPTTASGWLHKTMWGVVRDVGPVAALGSFLLAVLGLAVTHGKPFLDAVAELSFATRGSAAPRPEGTPEPTTTTGEAF